MTAGRSTQAVEPAAYDPIVFLWPQEWLTEALLASGVPVLDTVKAPEAVSSTLQGSSNASDLI